MTMDARAIEEAWTLVDRDALASLARSGATPVFATISGAHLYGFASPDSDVDLRGAFLLPAEDLLGLLPPRETVAVQETRAGVEVDWVAHDLRKFAAMMIHHNGYALEQLFSPLVVLTSPAHEELLSLGRGCVTRPTVRHYRGFARGRRRRLAEPNATVKHLLYAYRVYLAGIHAMRTGAIEAHLPSLNAFFGLRQIDELIARKRAGAESLALTPGEVAAHEAHLDRLEADLDAAHDASRLPEEATTKRDLNAFVVRVRLDRAAR
jgi:predicted nucleotidyltransferase